MNQAERLMLVDRMKFLVSELHRLEKYCPTNPVPYGTSPPSLTLQSQPPCFMLKCQLPKCNSYPNLEPLITWTPVMEVRKTTNSKVCTNPPENPLVKHLYVDPLRKSSMCGTMDPCMGHCPILRDHDVRMAPSARCATRTSLSRVQNKCELKRNVGQSPSGRASIMSYKTHSKCVPGYSDGTVELCCPTFGPPVDSCGQPYHCQVTLDGRSACKPTDDIPTRPQIGCERQQPQSRFPKCDEKKIQQQGKNLNTRRSICDPPKSNPPSRCSTSKDKPSARKSSRGGKFSGNYYVENSCNCCNCMR